MEQVNEVAYALDTFYFLLSGLLVMWMAAGFTMLEAGMVRTKNTVEILTKNVGLYSIACLMYLFIGWDIMYESGGGAFGAGVIPTISDVFLSSAEPGSVGDEFSYWSDFFFQVVFVATAMSIVSGAVAERMKLSAFLIFAVVMTGVIYPVQGMWTWTGDGWLASLGYSDYAGSGIVHMSGAAAALAAVLVLGPRKGRYRADGGINAIPGANLPLSTLGTFILWMGWFGFNGGSELSVSTVTEANNVAAVFLNTNTAAAAGVVAAMIVSKVMFSKVDLTMALNGALAGLVAITAAPAGPSPLLALVVGAIGGGIVVFSIVGIDKLKIDDPVGAISVHGVVGIWGVLAVLFSNGDATFGAQLLGIIGIFAWVFIASLIVWLILKAVMGIRASDQEQDDGLDIADCGMEAYPEFTRTQ